MTAEVISILRRLSEIRKDLVRTEQELLALDHLLEPRPSPVLISSPFVNRRKPEDLQVGASDPIEIFYLSLKNIDTIERFVDHCGYISHDKHQDFHDLLKELREYKDHVCCL